MSHDENPPTAGRRLTRAEKQAVINDSVSFESKAHDPHVTNRRQLYAESAAGILADLAQCGFEVQSVGELRQLGLKYQVAVPVLLDWIPRVSYLPLVEDIVRTLSVGFAKKEALPVFLHLFRHPPAVEDRMRPSTSQPAEEHIRWVIGNGLGIFACPAVSDELISLAKTREYGDARSQIVLNLPKVKSADVPRVLLGLLDDPTVASSAIEALGKMKFVEAREQIERLLDHSDSNVRLQAKKALKRIGS
jgi:HEAT repeat protein